MGRYDLCILTANTYLNHIKEQFKLMEENPIKQDPKKKIQQAKVIPETQFIKNHCHPHLSEANMDALNLKINDNRLHPLYDFEADK